jgi:CheY-like chemotaxis protein
VRILQVESNRDAAMAVERLVTAGGSTCDTAATGMIALERAMFEPFDLILIAFALPDLTGAELLHRLDAAGVNATVIVRLRNQPVAKAYAEILQRIAGISDGQDDAAGQADGGHQRDSVRHKILKAGKIIYRNASCVMDCTILNISASGACIQPADAFDDPEPFTLKINNGPTRRCEVRWRSGGKLGVRFIQ